MQKILLPFLSFILIPNYLDAQTNPTLQIIDASPRLIDVSTNTESTELRLIFGQDLSDFSGGFIRWRNDADDSIESTLVKRGPLINKHLLTPADFQFASTEPNNELRIPLVVSRQTPSGSYSLQTIELHTSEGLIANYEPSPRGTLTITNSKVMKLSAYESFLERYPQLTVDNQDSKYADPDSDGIQNIFEAEFDSDPFALTHKNSEALGYENLPQITLSSDAAAFTYTGLQILTPQSSLNLSDWAEITNDLENQNDIPLKLFSSTLPQLTNQYYRLHYKELEIQNLSEQITTTSAQLSWQTDKLATSQIEYGLTQDLDHITEIQSTLSTQHNLTLSGLKNLTTYYYRVRSISGNGVLGHSEIREFRTPAVDFDLSNAVLASSFGFDPEDSTEALEAAFASDSPLILVDRQASDWVIGPIRSFPTDKTIVFEEGVTVQAKAGAFPEAGNALLAFINPLNLNIYGYGAHFKMNKLEYPTDEEGRHGLSILSGTNVIIEGLSISDSGTDGIYLGVSETRNYNENIRIHCVVCDNNTRQGMSIISAQDVWVTDSTFSNTKGHLPESGVDLEPNRQDERLVNINFDGCNFSNNNHAGFQLAPQHLNSDSIPISISVKNSYFSMNHVPEHPWVSGEIDLGTSEELLSPVQGSLEFENIHFDGSLWGLFHTRKPDIAYDVNFKNIVAENMGQAEEGYRGMITFEIGALNNEQSSLGNMSFENTSISYDSDVPVIYLINQDTLESLKDVTGEISVSNPNNIEELIFHRNGPMTLDNVTLDISFTP